MKKTAIYVIFTCLFILNFEASATSDSSHNVPNQLKVIFPYQSLKFYANSINDFKNSNLPVITDKFKKKFKINGSYIDEDNKEIIFSGNARITGDGLDHIDLKNNISSLSINIKNTNIGGVTKFRLLLPETRNSEYEIFWSLLMSEIGFPVPLRKMINVNINGSDKIFIFEEKPEKEFIESVGYRESPIVESDERQLWHLRSFGRTEKKISDQYIQQYKLKNPDFMKSDVSEKIALMSIAQLSINNEIINYFDELNELIASHALIDHNRKYIYDPIMNDYIPIYFDGNIGMRDIDKENIDKLCKDFNRNEYPTLINHYVDVINYKFIQNSLGKKMSSDMTCLATKTLSKAMDSEYFKKINFKRNKQLSKINLDFKLTPKNILEEKSMSGYPDIVELNFNNKTIKNFIFNKSSNSYIHSNNIPYSELKKYITGDDKPKKINDYKIYNLVSINGLKSNFNESFEELNLDGKSMTINVNENEIKFIKLKSNDSNIKIYLKSNNSKIIFYQSEINDSNIEIKSNDSGVLFNNGKIDENILTSCLTILNSNIKKTNLKSTNCNLEDSINFISTVGYDIDLNVSNSKFDGIDADYSQLNFSNVKISNSGNDCIDLSSGVYNFKNIKTTDCGDKGLSVGEKSLVAVNNFSIINSDIGIAVKDQSTLHLDKFYNKNVNECINLYRKKKEFGPAKLNFKNNTSSCKVTLKNFSTQNKGNICSFVDKNYFFESCVNGSEYKVTFTKKIPSDAILFHRIYKNEKEIDLDNKANTLYKKHCLDADDKCSIILNGENKFFKFGIKNLKSNLDFSSFVYKN